jgi:hypothetical protein
MFGNMAGQAKARAVADLPRRAKSVRGLHCNPSIILVRAGLH